LYLLFCSILFKPFEKYDYCKISKCLKSVSSIKNRSSKNTRFSKIDQMNLFVSKIHQLQCMISAVDRFLTHTILHKRVILKYFFTLNRFFFGRIEIIVKMANCNEEYRYNCNLTCENMRLTEVTWPPALCLVSYYPTWIQASLLLG